MRRRSSEQRNIRRRADVADGVDGGGWLEASRTYTLKITACDEEYEGAGSFGDETSVGNGVR